MSWTHRAADARAPRAERAGGAARGRTPFRWRTPRTKRAARTLAVPAVALALLSGSAGYAPAQAGTTNPVQPASPRQLVSGWIPYWAIDAGVTSVQTNPDLFADVVGFWHSAEGKTSIADQASDVSRAQAVAAIHGVGVQVLGGVTDGTGAHTMSNILSTKAGRADHAKALVKLALANHYDGIDLDYEGFAFHDGSGSWSKTRPRWVAFVKTLSTRLHARGMTLSVAAPAMYDSDRDSSSGYWVYDYKGIARYVDRLRIMTYDYNVSSPGAIAPISWVRRVLDYATSVVPAGKIQVGVPAYGRDWPQVTSDCPTGDYAPRIDSLTSREANTLAAGLGITPTWDAATGERTFTYKKTWTGTSKSCTITQRVWYEEDKAALLRAKLVGEYHLGGIAQWTIGGEDRGQWDDLRAYALSISKVSPKVELFAGNMVYGSKVRVHAVARTASGSPIAGEDWRLSRRYAGSSTWTVVARGVTSATGTMSIDRAPSRNAYWKLFLGGSWGRYSAETGANLTSVASRVSAHFDDASTKAGRTVHLKGYVAPAAGGLHVTVQRRVSGSWRTVGSTTTGSKGGYGVAVTAHGHGYSYYRAKVAATSRHGSGHSAVVRLTVS